MATRKGWDDLTPAYKARLTRNHISKAQYERGDSLSGARGHSRTPEQLTGYSRLADSLGIGFVAPEWDYMEPGRDKNEIARDFVTGYMSRGQLKRPRITRNAKGKESRVTQTAAQRAAAERFNAWIYEERNGEFSSEDWKTYRALYLSHFGSKKG